MASYAIDTIVFDKTGTLTKGVFNVSDVHTMNDFSQEELIAIATHAEYYSTHPISSSLKAIHHSACCEQYKPEFVDELAGFGIKAIVNGKEVLAGNDVKMACGFPHSLIAAVEAGVLTREDMLACAKRVIDLILKID